jgi:hypothetical protein
MDMKILILVYIICNDLKLHFSLQICYLLMGGVTAGK